MAVQSDERTQAKTDSMEVDTVPIQNGKGRTKRKGNSRQLAKLRVKRVEKGQKAKVTGGRVHDEEVGDGAETELEEDEGVGLDDPAAEEDVEVPQQGLGGQLTDPLVGTKDAAGEGVDGATNPLDDSEMLQPNLDDLEIPLAEPEDDFAEPVEDVPTPATLEVQSLKASLQQKDEELKEARAKIADIELERKYVVDANRKVGQFNRLQDEIERLKRENKTQAEQLTQKNRDNLTMAETIMELLVKAGHLHLDDY